MFATRVRSRWCSHWCRVLASDTYLTLAHRTDVSAVILLLIWVAVAPIVVEAEESTPSTIWAVPSGPKDLCTVGIAERRSHRRGWSGWRRRWWRAVQVEGGKGGLAASRLLHRQDLSSTLNCWRRMVLERTSRWRWIRRALCITEATWEGQSLENPMLGCSSIGLGSPPNWAMRSDTIPSCLATRQGWRRCRQRWRWEGGRICVVQLDLKLDFSRLASLGGHRQGCWPARLLERMEHLDQRRQLVHHFLCRIWTKQKFSEELQNVLVLTFTFNYWILFQSWCVKNLHCRCLGVLGILEM